MRKPDERFLSPVERVCQTASVPTELEACLTKLATQLLGSNPESPDSSSTGRSREIVTRQTA